MSQYAQIQSLLGAEADSLLMHQAKVSKDMIHVPSPTFVDNVFGPTDRSPQVLRSLQAMYGHGRLGHTGYLSILPVDQGIEHSAGASFAKNPIYFDGENIVKLAMEGGCNAVATTFGVLASVSRKYAHKIPFLVKINHNELMTYPNKFDQIMFGSVREAWNLGAVAVGATIYFGSDNSTRQIVEVARAFEEANSLGMEPSQYFDLVFKREKGKDEASDEFEDFPAREKLARETLLRAHQRAVQLKLIETPEALQELTQGNMPDIAPKPVIAFIIDPAISPGLEKVVPNFDILPGDLKKEAPTDLEIAVARNLAGDLYSAQIIDRDAEKRITAHFRPPASKDQK